MARSRAVVVALLATASLGGWWLGRSGGGDTFQATVVATFDGDTIAVRAGGGRTGAVTVRLLGVDTPETHHPRRPVGCHGPSAAAATRRLLLGRRVRLTLDTQHHDRYGRLLAHVWLGRLHVNRWLLRHGHARLLVIRPNTAYARRMLLDELDARRRRVGLWGRCGTRW